MIKCKENKFRAIEHYEEQKGTKHQFTNNKKKKKKLAKESVLNIMLCTQNSVILLPTSKHEIK